MGKKLNANESFRLWMNGLGIENIKKNLENNVNRDEQGRILISKDDEWNCEDWRVDEIMEQLLKEKIELRKLYNDLSIEIGKKQKEIKDLIFAQDGVNDRLIKLDMKTNKAKKQTTVYENSIYKHFKGNIIVTMKLSKPVDISMIDFEVKYTNATHSETKADLTIIIDNDNNYTHDKNVSHEELVLYKTLYNDTGVFARPKSMFLSKVDRVKYPDCEQEYRLELVK